MTVQEYKMEITELVRQFVNAVAEKEYGKLASIVRTESWCKPEETQEEGFLSFGNWLDQQLADWEEEEGRPFVVDHFEESCLDLDEEGFLQIGDGKCACPTYNPTNSGEPLDFWFEFETIVKEDGTLSVVFDINI